MREEYLRDVIKQLLDMYRKGEISYEEMKEIGWVKPKELENVLKMAAK